MKKRILTLALMLSISLSSIFANTREGVNEKVMNTFKTEFANARDVKWESSKDFVKATFILNEQVLFAYYSLDGEQIAVSRNIVSSQLPINLLADLKKNYSEFWISDLFEIATKTDTGYYVTIENGDFTIVLKSNGGSGWNVYKKDRKIVS
ncbi:MAG TPA: hypothetical protein VM012_10910 [Flavitalea sp.]|nr:hypothetical protein [Flavitalea sp.]